MPRLAPVTTTTLSSSRPMSGDHTSEGGERGQSQRPEWWSRRARIPHGREELMAGKPAVSLVAVAGRRRATVELAQRLEREGFTGIYCPSPGDGFGLCEV